MKFGDVLMFKNLTALIILNDDGEFYEMIMHPGLLVVKALREDVEELLESELTTFHEAGIGLPITDEWLVSANGKRCKIYRIGEKHNV